MNSRKKRKYNKQGPRKYPFQIGLLAFVFLSVFFLNSCHPEFEEKCFDPYYMGGLRISLQTDSLIPYKRKQKTYVFNTYRGVQSLIEVERDEDTYNGIVRNLPCSLDTTTHVGKAFWDEKRNEVRIYIYESQIAYVDLCYTPDVCELSNTGSLKQNANDILIIAFRDYDRFRIGSGAVLTYDAESSCGFETFEENYIGQVKLGERTFEDVYLIKMNNSTFSKVYYSHTFGVIGLENSDASVYYYLHEIL